MMAKLVDPYLSVDVFLKTRHPGILDMLNELDERINDEIRLLAQDENHLFSSVRSRLQYLLSKNIIPKYLYDHLLRYKESLSFPHENTEALNFKGIQLWLKLLEIQTGHHLPERFLKYLFSPESVEPSSSFSNEYPNVRISFLDFSEDRRALKFVISNQTEHIHLLELKGLRPKQMKHVLQCIQYLQFPFDAWAHRLTYIQGYWSVDSLVLMPDFLVDVTTVAGCFHATESNPLKHFIQLYLYRPTGLPALIGNAVNYFLDELIIHKDSDADSMLQSVFHQNPLAFSLLNDDQIKLFTETVRLHFKNIKEVITSQFGQKLLHLNECLLEPSFYALNYGIQGRLDVFYQNLDDTLIVELKSGKPYMPNKFGVNTEHYAQTLLYHLMIESVYQIHHSIQAYVLYSSQSTQALRKTDMEPGMKEKLIDLRNALITMHLHMAFHPKSENFILDQLNINHFAQTETYTKRDAILLLSIYQALMPHEKDYYKEFTGFIAREQLISKTGRAQSQYIEGLASLWLLSVSEKRKQHMLLSGLRIIEIVSDPKEYPILVLEESATEVHLANFRIGDTLILYRQPSALQEQIFKATLIDIQSGKYWIRLRTRQFPEKLISEDAHWNIEHDFLDRSFLYQYQNLCDWAKSSPQKRNLLLGIQKPESLKNIIYDLHPETPQAIKPILQKILNAKEYYLVWGPPGSGKTSMVIRFLADALINKCHENILLLAYTNRAVDEICEVLDWIKKDSGSDYIRIGSRYGVQEKFRSQLLDERIKSLKGRADTLELLRTTPIFVATIASMQGKKELFELKNFDTVIVDEASQILEVQIVGLLTKFNRFILIGDHMQLPAVSAQTELEANIQSDRLRKLKITQLNMSFFERLYLQCKSQHWDEAFTMLELQGRMHQQIMDYPARMFYEGQLSILPDGLNARQKRNYQDLFKVTSTKFQNLLSTHRTIFVPSNLSENIIGSKTNFLEAELIAKLVQAIYNLYKENGLAWTEMSLGVITPFRAQIALIKQQFLTHSLPAVNQITVDTAERYQGGARDIIILSTVITDAGQLSQISSVTEQGADRKLNVALTRAKEQIILVGNPDALTESQHYKNLINEYTLLDPNLIQNY